MRSGERFHSGHPNHRLILEHKERPYTCTGCGELGLGTRYACAEGCNFLLHKDCASPRDTVIHPFFPGCVFRFLERGKPNRVCDACGRDVNGFVYHCFDEGWDLHPSCANLPREMEAGGLRLALHHELSAKCDRCGHQKPNYGSRSWSYVSACKNYQLHVACVKEILVESWGRKHFSGSSSRGGSSSSRVEESRDLVIRASNLKIVIDNGKRKTGKLEKFLKILKIVITSIMAALVGDPTTMVAALIHTFISS